MGFKEELKGFITKEIETKTMVKGKEVLGKKRTIDWSAVATLREGLVEEGFIIFHEETLVRKIAGLRMVPGNEARAMIETLKKAGDYK